MERGETSMEDCRVSIVIPIFNSEEHLEQALGSVIGQSYKNIEIICVDDGSIDDSKKIVKRYMAQDSRILLIEQENLYAGVARNTGMAIAKGKYIMFLDSDDYFEENMIEELVANAERYHSDIVLCDAYYFDDQTGEITEKDFILNKSMVGKYDVFSRKDFPQNIVSATCYGPWTKLYNFEFIKKNNLKYQPIKRNNDIFFTYMTMILANRISYVAKKFIYYRTNNEKSLQGQMQSFKNSTYFYEAFVEIRDQLLIRGIYEETKIEFINNLVWRCNNLFRRSTTYSDYVQSFYYVKNKVFLDFDVYKLVNIEPILTRWFINMVEACSAEEFLFEKSNPKSQFIYGLLKKFENEKKEKIKIAIYGAGNVGKTLYDYLSRNENFEITGWYDANYEKLQSKGINVDGPHNIKNNFDYIIIAIGTFNVVWEIKEMLIKFGIEREKILI